MPHVLKLKLFQALIVAEITGHSYEPTITQLRVIECNLLYVVVLPLIRAEILE